MKPRVVPQLPSSPIDLRGMSRSFAPMVSIVIPTHNKVNLTLGCLNTISARTPESISHEVILVDNGSTDSTRDVLSHLPDYVTVVLNDTNEGFAAAGNAGFARARGKYVIFMHNDVTVLPGWLAPLYDAMEQDPQLGAIQPRMLTEDGRLASAGGLVFRNTAVDFGAGSTTPRKDIFEQRRAVDFVNSACMMVRATAFTESGGFDEDYAPHNYESIDLSMRMHYLGYKTVYEPASNVMHLGGETLTTEFTPEYIEMQIEHNKTVFSHKWSMELATRPEYTDSAAAMWATRNFGSLEPLPARSPVLT